MSLSAAAFLEKNTLNDTGVWLLLLTIEIPGFSTLYLVRNNENITWPASGGDEYLAFPFEIDEISDASDGSVPQVVIRVSNISKSIGAYIENSSGGIDSIITLRVIHSEHLDLTDPEIEFEFKVLKTEVDLRWVSFTMGASNPYTKIFPGHRVLQATCRYREFKGDHCGYVGSETECNRSYERCTALQNLSRFGNAVSVGSRGLYV